MENNEHSEDKGHLKWIDLYEQGRPEEANEEYLNYNHFSDSIPNIHIAYHLHNRRARNRVYLSIGIAILAIIIVCWLINNLT